MRAQSAAGRNQPPSSGVRAIVELTKLINEFLTKVDGALYIPYSLARAQKDYEVIALTLAHVEKILDEKDMLHLSQVDSLTTSTTIEKLVERAVEAKSSVDAEFQKIAAASAAAATRS